MRIQSENGSTLFVECVILVIASCLPSEVFMRSKWMTLWFLFGLIAAACASRPVGESLTALPPQPTPAWRSISFTTPDGATLGGTLYGRGETAVIFSVMGNCSQGWGEMASLAADHGIMALTYQWRGCKESGTVVDDEMKKFVDDLRGAINFMRDQGVKRIILAGASLGGCASAKLAVESQASGLVVIASPAQIPGWRFEIYAADMNTDIPKLFITAENDDTVAAGKTHGLYDLASEPKEWQTYPGTAHGTDLFKTESGDQLQQKILDFVLSIAAKP